MVDVVGVDGHCQRSEWQTAASPEGSRIVRGGEGTVVYDVREHILHTKQGEC